MFSFRSALKISISWCESMPNSTLRAPTSLAKPTLSAWNALSTYFAASATRIGTRKMLSAKSPYISTSGSPLAASSSPDHGLLGVVEVGDAAALAQVLGVHGDAEVAARLQPRAPLERGDDRLLGRAREHRAADHDGVPPLGVSECRARCPRRRARARARSSDPCEPDGVPTQMSETSVARIASAASCGRAQPTRLRSRRRSPRAGPARGPAPDRR